TLHVSETVNTAAPHVHLRAHQPCYHPVDMADSTSTNDQHALSLPDLIVPGLEILFVGINPGMKSARVGHYYAGLGNLFWRCLHESGVVPVLVTRAADGP